MRRVARLTLVVCFAAALAAPAASAHPKGVWYTPAEAWRALHSSPGVNATFYGTEGERRWRTGHFRVVGPATTLARDVKGVGAPRVVNGQRKWLHFSVQARLNGDVYNEAVFCMHPLSPVRTTYPYSNFLLTSFSPYKRQFSLSFSTKCPTDKWALVSSARPG
jgi:hypothetical protein